MRVGRRLVAMTLPVVLTVSRSDGDNRSAQSAPGPEVIGQWGPLVPTVTWGKHSVLLPSGRVLLIGGIDCGPPGCEGGVGTYDGPPLAIGDPETGVYDQLPDPGAVIGNGGHAFLPDGRLLLIGGEADHGYGIRNVFALDPESETLSALPPMTHGRYYGTALTLSSGGVLAVGGQGEDGEGVMVPELWDGRTWNELTGASRSFNRRYNFLTVSPDGRMFFAGPEDGGHLLDVESQSWVTGTDPLGRKHSSIAHYGGGRLVVSGGCRLWCVGDEERLLTYETIDLTSTEPVWTEAGRMSIGRQHHDSTILPDGTVLITGGTTFGDNYFETMKGAVLEAELWDPATRTATRMAPMDAARGSHSSAILLRDGSVMVAGGWWRPVPEGLPSTQEELGRWLLQPETPQTLTEELLKWPLYPERTTQIFYPPYFFKGPRPIIVSAPSNVTYGTHFLVDVAEPKTVADVTWVRLGASTHGIDQSTRFNRLAFSETSTGLRVVTPSSPNLAPPGPYNLFVIDREGVPSEGVTLLVRGNAP